MFKLKLFLFLSKFSRYFKEMAENYIIQKIKNEILIHLNEYENKHFEVIQQAYLSNNQNHLIKIDITYQKISIAPFSFSLLLEYSGIDNIEKNIKIKDEIDKRGKIIFEYFDYFETIPEDLILKYFKSLK